MIDGDLFGNSPYFGKVYFYEDRNTFEIFVAII